MLTLRFPAHGASYAHGLRRFRPFSDEGEATAFEIPAPQNAGVRNIDLQFSGKHFMEKLGGHPFVSYYSGASPLGSD